MLKPLIQCFVVLLLCNLYSNTLLANSILLASDISFATDNLRYNELKRAVFADPYDELPFYQVKKRHFGSKGKTNSNHLLQAAKRTLQDPRDLIDFPQKQKLLQANGICFAGQWQIHSNSLFSGLFSANTETPVIARASVALSGTLQKHKRAFGIAIKLLPQDLGNSPSLNIFTLHSLGGTVTPHVLDLSLDNQPPLGQLPRWSDLGTALRLRRDLERADKAVLAQSGNPKQLKPQVAFRPIDHIAKYKANQVVTPKWLRLRAQSHERQDKNDFRDELNVKYYSDNSIRYSIDVAPEAKSKRQATWQTIGELHLTESVTSKTCDQRLHFQHPRLD